MTETHPMLISAQNPFGFIHDEIQDKILKGQKIQDIKRFLWALEPVKDWGYVLKEYFPENYL